ncbi:MAG TPA: AAA family ATPase, partial [Gaiellaceae bacterium]|nr:AAA family ATPase [Gaiellaceae bacterium]
MDAAGPVVEERRVLTLLAADLVGSTAVGEVLDPEEARLVVGGAVARMVAAVEALGGTVKDLAGDGVFCLFGAPVAHEDDPERAVRAGLRIAETIAAYAEEVECGWGVRGFGVRVGVATGAVVVGPIGAGGRVEYGATGDAANTAARLQAAAEPATVLVDEATRRLVEPLFAWGEPRSLRLKGKERPVLATPALSVLAAIPERRLDAPLVGRERELATARDALADVLAGTGGVLFVTGEPGIGKSRLLAELRREFASASSAGGRPLWLEGQAASYSDTVPYALFRNLLGSWLELPAGQPELRVRVALRRTLEGLFGVEGAALEPQLAVLLGLEVEEASLGRRPQTVRQRVVAAVETLLARLARDGPVVVALDDVQWADPSSLELLDRLLALPDREPILLALAQRIELAHPSWELRQQALRTVPHRTREVSLAPLPEEADAELLAALVEHGTIPDELASRLLTAAGGNPFFLEELVHSLRDAGALVRAEGRWRVDRDVELTVPESVQSVVLARLDRLPAPARNL